MDITTSPRSSSPCLSEDVKRERNVEPMKEDSMELSPSSDLIKPVDLSNNNNNNNNSIVTSNHNNNNNNHNGKTHTNDNLGGSIVIDNGLSNGHSFFNSDSSSGGGGGNNNVTRMESKGLKKLSFSVENILDPNKFTGKVSLHHGNSNGSQSNSNVNSFGHPVSVLSGLTCSPKSLFGPTGTPTSNDLLSTSNAHHHHHHLTSTNFRFPFKDIHG